MADVSAPEIAAAYDDVRSDKTPTTWLLLDYTSDKSNALTVSATGMGDLDEVKAKLDDGKAQFAYVRVKYANDVESTREKFILIIWIGSGVGVMRKAKVSVHAADVKSVLRSYSIDVPAREKSDINEMEIVTRLQKAGGAFYGHGNNRSATQ